MQLLFRVGLVEPNRFFYYDPSHEGTAQLPSSSVSVPSGTSAISPPSSTIL